MVRGPHGAACLPPCPQAHPPPAGRHSSGRMPATPAAPSPRSCSPPHTASGRRWAASCPSWTSPTTATAPASLGSVPAGTRPVSPGSAPATRRAFSSALAPGGCPHPPCLRPAKQRRRACLHASFPPSRRHVPLQYRCRGGSVQQLRRQVQRVLAPRLWVRHPGQRACSCP